MLVNGVSVFSQNIDKVKFSKQRNILVHTNYEKAITKRRRFNRLYVEDGNSLSFYSTNRKKGVINILPDSIYNFKIYMDDTYGNESTISFTVKGKDYSNDIPSFNSKSNKSEWWVDDNVLIFKAKIENRQAPLSELFIGNEKVTITPKYIEKGEAVYLWNLKLGIPDSIDNCHKIFKPQLNQLVPSKVKFNYYNEIVDLEFKKYSLFDTTYLKVDYEYDSTRNLELFTIGNILEPVRNSYKVTFKPKKIYENNDEHLLYSVSGRSFSYIGGKWKGTEVEANIRQFGTFTFLRDSLAPTIRVIEQNSQNLKFIIRDDLSGIKSYNAYVNGKWVLLHYDYKRRLLWSEKKDKTIPFKGELVVKVEDRTGNINTYKTNI